MCCGGGFGGGGGGGSTGNINGDLTAPFLPYASAAHTLADSPIKRTGADEITVIGSIKSEADAALYWSKSSGGASSVASSDLWFFRSEGTVAAPEAVADGDVLGGFDWFGYVPSPGYWGCASMRVSVDGAVTGPHNIATKMEFAISDAAGNPLTALSLRHGPDTGADIRLPVTFHKPTRKLYTALATTAGLVQVDADVGERFKVNVDVNIAMTNPIHAREGQFFQVRFKQTAGGGHTISYDTKFRFPDGISPLLSVADGAIDYQAFQYDEDDDMWDYAGGAPNLQVPS